MGHSKNDIKYLTNIFIFTVAMITFWIYGFKIHYEN